MNLILLGGPGSGKGTQAGLIEKNLGLVHLSTGDLFRENIGNETELGVLAKSYIDRGDLVPDDVTVDMVHDRLNSDPDLEGVVFDGFPRTINQANALNVLLAEKGWKIDAVLHIVVPESEIVRRLSGRLLCSNCQQTYHVEFNPFIYCPTNSCEGQFLYQREDDKPETVRARLHVYQERTAPLIEYYEERSLLIKIDGDGTVEEVFAAILDALEIPDES
jgi:adenylate kinase